MHVQLYQLSWLTADSHKPCCHPWFVCHGISQHNVLAHSGSPHDAEASSQYMWLRLQYVMVTRQYNIIIHFGFNFCLWNTHTLNNTHCVFSADVILAYSIMIYESVMLQERKMCTPSWEKLSAFPMIMYIVQVSCCVYASQTQQLVSLGTVDGILIHKDDIKASSRTKYFGG